MIYEEKLRKAVECLMADSPDQYIGESIEEVMKEIRGASEAFLDHAIEWFPIDESPSQLVSKE